MKILVRIRPNAKRGGITGESGGRLKIAVGAPAADGRANEALIKFLACKYGVPKSAIRITSGLSSRDKTVEIAE
ncbi:MAG: DUF167 domain-containing protein [Rickettsiales bacterium]|jgi:uncharacterized protein (TIGR00251 family)|nr:DUF167 domain-containing protein [Rickettsiales bacterium]